MDVETRQMFEAMRAEIGGLRRQLAGVPSRFMLPPTRKAWRFERFTSDQTWTVPATSDGHLIIIAIGGGGGGGGEDAATANGVDSNGDTLTFNKSGGNGGQSGGGILASVILAPGTDIDIVVGTGGAFGTPGNIGSNGSASSVTVDGGSTLSLSGAGGLRGTTGAPPGQASGTPIGVGGGNSASGPTNVLISYAPFAQVMGGGGSSGTPIRAGYGGLGGSLGVLGRIGDGGQGVPNPQGWQFFSNGRDGAVLIWY